MWEKIDDNKFQNEYKVSLRVFIRFFFFFFFFRIILSPLRLGRRDMMMIIVESIFIIACKGRARSAREGKATRNES